MECSDGKNFIMFSPSGHRNDHPGWNHFEFIDVDLVVCKHCELCFCDVNLHELLQHVEARHSDVNFDQMKVAMKKLKPDVTPASEKLVKEIANREKDETADSALTPKERVNAKVSNWPATDYNDEVVKAINTTTQNKSGFRKMSREQPSTATTEYLESSTCGTFNVKNVSTEFPPLGVGCSNSHRQLASDNAIHHECSPLSSHAAPSNPLPIFTRLRDQAHTNYKEHSLSPDTKRKYFRQTSKQSKGPQVAPGTTPNSCYSAELKRCEADLDRGYVIVNRYSTFHKYRAACNKMKIDLNSNITVYGTSKKTFYCSQRLVNQCNFKVVGLECSDQYGLYKLHDHNHTEKEDLLEDSLCLPNWRNLFDWTRFDNIVRSSKKSRNGTLTLDDIQKHLKKCWKLVKTYKNFCEMDTDRKRRKVIPEKIRFVAINDKWTRAHFICEVDICSYSVVGIYSDSEFGLFDRGEHFHACDEKNNLPNSGAKKRGFCLLAYPNTSDDHPPVSQKHSRPAFSLDDHSKDPAKASHFTVSTDLQETAISESRVTKKDTVDNPQAVLTNSVLVAIPQLTADPAQPSPQNVNVYPPQTVPITDSMPISVLQPPETSSCVADVPADAPAKSNVAAPLDQAQLNPVSIDPTVYRIVPNITTEDAINKRISAENLCSLGLYPMDGILKQFYKCSQPNCKYRMLSKIVTTGNCVLYEMGLHSH